MDPEIPRFFSIRNDAQGEEQYITGLIQQFLHARDQKAFHLGLFAYHLLFICYFYQVLFRLKLWFPDKYHTSLIPLEADRRIQFRRATGPIDYPHGRNSETQMFELLNMFCDCEQLVKRCQTLVRQRNKRLGHVTYILSSEEDFEGKIHEYDQIAEEIHQLTQEKLPEILSDFISDIDSELTLTIDEIETGLVVPHKMSIKDLEYLNSLCSNEGGDVYSQISDVLEHEYGVERVGIARRL